MALGGGVNGLGGGVKDFGVSDVLGINVLGRGFVDAGERSALEGDAEL
jgi:hypothetical protein